MRAVLQRVLSAKVEVDGEIVGTIDGGLLVLLGVEQGDSNDDLKSLLDKTVALRIFEDDAGKMNRSVTDTGGGVLVVSQFTLLADCRKGRRPGFTDAAPPEEADFYYQAFVSGLKGLGLNVATGIFQADMQVSLVNNGPVTILLDSRKRF
jgi:D-tyrosyl-tRNA(Tyr) deacylase